MVPLKSEKKKLLLYKVDSNVTLYLFLFNFFLFFLFGSEQSIAIARPQFLLSLLLRKSTFFFFKLQTI